MILLHYPLKSIGRMVFRNTAIKALQLNHIFIYNRIRTFVTEETAVQKLSFRSLKKRKTNFALGSWFLLVIPASAFGLGTWQVLRKFEKDKLNQEHMKILEQPAVDFPNDLEELKNMQYQRIRIRGKFDHSKEIFLGPRAKIDEFTEKLIPSLISRSNPGYLIVTPFKLSDRDLTILVNRGWVSTKEKLPSTRPKGQITEEVELIGILRPQENRKPLGMKNKPEKNIWVYRDIKEMSKKTGAAPIFLDAEKSSTIPGGPLGGQMIMGLRNEHLSYIFTWYGLSTASGYLWYIWHFQKIRILV